MTIFHKITHSEKLVILLIIPIYAKVSYNDIRLRLIKGLKMLKELSLAVSTSSDMQKLQQVIGGNEQLRNHNNKLENNAEKHTQEQSVKITSKSYLLAIMVATSTFVGLLLQDSLTDYFRNPIVKIEHSLNLNKVSTLSIGKK